MSWMRMVGDPGIFMALTFKFAINLQIDDNKINPAGFCRLSKPGIIGKKHQLQRHLHSFRQFYRH